MNADRDLARAKAGAGCFYVMVAVAVIVVVFAVWTVAWISGAVPGQPDKPHSPRWVPAVSPTPGRAGER